MKNVLCYGDSNTYGYDGRDPFGGRLPANARWVDLLGGMLCLSGLYDSTWFWDGWCNDILYDNSPAVFLANMPADHPYIDIYNQRKIVICAGQGPWEDAGLPSVYAMRDIFTAKGIHAWVDLWGHDVSHDWPWWKKEMRYFLPHFI